MTEQRVEIGAWASEMEVRFVEGLPHATGGAVSYYDGETRWVLVDPHLSWDDPPQVNVLAEWAAELIERSQFITARMVSCVFGLSLEQARGGWWLTAREWQNWKRVSAAS